MAVSAAREERGWHASSGHGTVQDLECLNDEDLNEPNIAMRRVNERLGDPAPRESYPGPRSEILVWEAGGPKWGADNSHGSICKNKDVNPERSLSLMNACLPYAKDYSQNPRNHNDSFHTSRNSTAFAFTFCKHFHSAMHPKQLYFSAHGSVPFGYVPSTFCTGVRPLRVRPDYFSAQGSVPFGYVPTTFPCTMQPAGQNALHLANPPGNTPRTPQVHWVGAFEPCSFGMRPVHIANLSGTSRLLFCTGVRPLRGSIPFGYVPTTFPCTMQPAGQNALHLANPPGNTPRTPQVHWGSIPFGYVPTTFPCTMQPAGQNALHLANSPGKTPRTPEVHWVGAFEPCCSFGMRPVHIANLSGTSRLLFYSGVRPLRIRPDYFSAQGSVPFGYVPTTFLLRGPSPSSTSRLLFCSGVRSLPVRPDYFSAQGSVPFGYDPTTFLLRGPSLSGTSRLLFCTGVRPDFKLLFRGPSPQVHPDFFIFASGITSPHIQSRREKTVIGSSISIINVRTRI
ncbi:hypothetical protein CRG98_035411 [Punica granatum]|uniref:Uncharacterized protein n=1 Tax=Punica granatum TaxID=22663 RepID=A0A2I0IJK7_PUNGR|nr:hypothetical protein CRG98_035411 [Punica granatum]